MAAMTPKRRILRRQHCWQAIKRGRRFLVYLECGHYERLTRTEARCGWVYCFDCLQGKPREFDPDKEKLDGR
jgi:hypothetical protein